MTEEYREKGEDAREFFYSENFNANSIYYSLRREIMGLFETDLFKSIK